MKFAKFLWAPCFTEHSSGCFWRFQVSSLQLYQESDSRKDILLWILQKLILRASFLLTEHLPPDDCFLCLSVNFKTFFRRLLLQSTSGKLLFYVQVAEFQPPDTVKTISQVLFKYFIQDREPAIRRRLFTKNSWKLFVKKLICYEVARCQPAYEKKLFNTSSFMHFAFIFSEYITIASSEEALKIWGHNLFLVM